jgi:hypothetical protein
MRVPLVARNLVLNPKREFGSLLSIDSMVNVACHGDNGEIECGVEMSGSIYTLW